MADRPDLDSARLDEAHIAVLLDRAANDLTQRFGAVFSAETTREVVQESCDLLAATARIRTHLPVLAGRFARDRLQAIAKNRGAVVSANPEVLFVCVHNAGRSQMAAGLLHHHAGDRVTVRAADVVITMGCGDACPVYPGKCYLNWELDDPAGQPVERVRVIRDEIDRRVRELLAELVPAH